MAINQDHDIEACILTDRFSHDDQQVIPPRSNAVENDKSAPQRNHNIVEIEMDGRRNYSELGVQRYQRAFGDAMHARDFPRQQQEAMIAIRKRFDDETINFLVKLAWWNWPVEKITKHLDSIVSGDLSCLKALI